MKAPLVDETWYRPVHQQAMLPEGFEWQSIYRPGYGDTNALAYRMHPVARLDEKVGAAGSRPALPGRGATHGVSAPVAREGARTSRRGQSDTKRR